MNMAKKKTVRDIRSERDVIMGDQHNIDAGRDVIMGDQVNITYALKMAGYEPPPDLQQLRVEYLQHLQQTGRPYPPAARENDIAKQHEDDELGPKSPPVRHMSF